jgi:DNA-directed RNA polymerase subunit RPC12/RpoP
MSVSGQAAGEARVLGSGRVVGTLLVVGGILFGIIGTAWLFVSGARAGGIVLGMVFLAILVLPLLGGGIYLLFRGQSEVKDQAEVQKQRMVLNMVETRGKVKISDIALEINGTREQVQKYIYDLVGKGLFTGYVNWREGVLLAQQASDMEANKTCPNCGGALELAGKGIVECPYCGSEIFLKPSGRS